MLKLLLYTTLTNTSKVWGGVTICFTPNCIFKFGGPLYANLGIVNYNQLHFFGFKKQLIKNTSFNENPRIEKLKCVLACTIIVIRTFTVLEVC